MTQPARAQEPSMEEILASIRRIIADDEAKPANVAKPPVAAAPKPEPPKPVPTPSKPAAMTPPPPAPSPAPQAAAPKPAAPPQPAPAPAPPPAPAAAEASNNQDDIDALLAGLDASTTEEEVRPPQPDGDVLELTDEMALPEPEPEPAPPTPTPLPQASYRKPVEDDLEFAEAAAPRPAAPEPKPAMAEPAYQPSTSSWSEEPPQAPIMSRATVSAVESAFNSLANTVLSNNARTLEDLVKEMLRPMLKSWLDDNLPTLVERIVRQEIERVSRGR
ncbi:DUF2497 domain-containing protein [Rhodopseudomonas palustris]|uniref:PopZ family protein n=1 Tax=Rhodopseudomonas palustris TaxID=1076 RepID=UPI002ACE3B6F|nr:DUF2497 domain-containing protein [Rhodopseudomonas palustris]WQH00688.1 DUF2497 domain-containing protein [Rhodopseudomonas palustris]